MDWSYDIMVPNYYVVWITVLTEKYSAPLVEELLGRGYTVTSASGDGRVAISTPNSVSSVIGLTLSKKDMLNSSFVQRDIREALHSIRAYYYSMVVMSSFSDVAWMPGNIVFEFKTIDTASTKSKQKPKHLKLVKTDPPQPNE